MGRGGLGAMRPRRRLVFTEAGTDFFRRRGSAADGRPGPQPSPGSKAATPRCLAFSP